MYGDKDARIELEDEIESEADIIVIRNEHNELLVEVRDAEHKLEFHEEVLRLFEERYRKFLID